MKKAGTRPVGYPLPSNMGIEMGLALPYSLLSSGGNRPAWQRRRTAYNPCLRTASSSWFMARCNTDRGVPMFRRWKPVPSTP